MATKKEQAIAAGCSIYRYDKDVPSRCYSMLQYPDGEYSHIERKTDDEAWEDFDPEQIQPEAPHPASIAPEAQPGKEDAPTHEQIHAWLLAATPEQMKEVFGDEVLKRESDMVSGVIKNALAGPAQAPANLTERISEYLRECECECDKSTGYGCERCSLLTILENPAVQVPQANPVASQSGEALTKAINSVSVAEVRDEMKVRNLGWMTEAEQRAFEYGASAGLTLAIRAVSALSTPPVSSDPPKSPDGQQATPQESPTADKPNLRPLEEFIPDLLELARSEDHDDKDCPQDDTCRCENIKRLESELKAVRLLRAGAIPEPVSQGGRTSLDTLREAANFCRKHASEMDPAFVLQCLTDFAAATPKPRGDRP